MQIARTWISIALSGLVRTMRRIIAGITLMSRRTAERVVIAVLETDIDIVLFGLIMDIVRPMTT